MTFYQENIDFLKKHFSTTKLSAAYPDAKKLITNLDRLKKLNFVKDWPPASQDQSKKIKLFKKLIQFDQEQSLSDYLKTCQNLLKKQKLQNKLIKNKSKNSSTNFFSPPPVIDLSELEDQKVLASTGMKILDQVSMVLVAGGLGQRLGSKEIKIKLTANAYDQKTFMEHYALLTLTLQQIFYQKYKKRIKIPLLIMTSDETHLPTTDYFKQNNYFSLSKSQVFFCKQESGPTIKNMEGELAVSNYEIDFLPLGHGSVHQLFYKKKITEQLLKQKKEFVFFFQDTHFQVKNIILSSLGAIYHYRKDFSFITANRKPHESLGVIMASHGEKETIQNIEYNQLSGLFEEKKIQQANTNSFWIKLKPYQKILKKTKGKLNAFINPKINEQGEIITPTRLESLMQDISMYFPPEKVTTLHYDRAQAFAPLKNSVLDKIKKPKSNPMTALELEENEFAFNRQLLAGNKFTGKSIKHLKHYSFSEKAKIILNPVLFGSEQLIKQCQFQKKSLLNCQVPCHLTNITFEENVAVIITQDPNIEVFFSLEDHRFTKNNGKSHGYELEFISAEKLLKNNDELLFDEAVRGYRIHWKNPIKFHFSKPGHYSLDKKNKVIKIK